MFGPTSPSYPLTVSPLHLTVGGTKSREHLKNMLKSIKMRVPTPRAHTFSVKFPSVELAGVLLSWSLVLRNSLNKLLV
jgi:hypothetical protein